MVEPVYALWAKMDNTDTSQGWHSLLCHMLDVGSVAREIWDNIMPRPVARQMASGLGLPVDEAGQWISLICGAHDMGKAAPGFQAKWELARSQLEGEGLAFPRAVETVHHGIITVPVLKPFLEETGFGLSSLSLATSVAGHHGVFAKHDDWLDLHERHLGNEKWEETRRHLFQRVKQALDVRGRISEPEPDNVFYILLAGLASVADWVGSSREHFPYEGHVADPDAYSVLARQRAKAALRSIGWQCLPQAVPVSFNDMFEFAPNEVQKAVMSVSRHLKGKSLVLIEAVMGQGKTEAAFWVEDEARSVRETAGAYVALPTEATSNQMFERIRGFLLKRFDSDRVNLHLVHGHAALSEAYQAIRVGAVHDDKAGEEGNVVAEEWFTPKKRALLSPFAVGTIDQALLSVLRVRHGFVRLFGLAGKTVILDEVHAYDTYTSTLIDRLLEWLSATGSSVVLLSATLPAHRRKELVRVYATEDAEVPDAPYPRVTWVTAGSSGAVGFPDPGRKRVSLLEVEPAIDKVAAGVVEKVHDGGCAAWICNTVDRAQAAYRALKALSGVTGGAGNPGFMVDLFHARYPFEERSEREKRVVGLFGKASPRRPARSVLVATQVVEQSLDVDFDFMVTDLAPVDLVLQRAGRVHRHPGTRRPPGLSAPEIWLLSPGTEGGKPAFAGGSLYDRYILLRSWLALKGRESLDFPEDIDALVQAVYKEDDGDLELGAFFEEWVKEARGASEEIRRRQKMEGLLRLIPSPDDPDGVLKAFDVELEEDDPAAHRVIQALTRQGTSVSVVCLHRSASGLALQPDGSEPLDLAEMPDQDKVRRILGRTVSLGHKGILHQLLSQEVPPAFRRSPYLRHHRYMVFEEGRCQMKDWEVVLDSELGLVINKKGDPAG